MLREIFRQENLLCLLTSRKDLFNPRSKGRTANAGACRLTWIVKLDPRVFLPVAKNTRLPETKPMDLDLTNNEVVSQGWGLEAGVNIQPVSDELGINSQNLVVESTTAKYLLKSVPVSQHDLFVESLRIQEHCEQQGAPVPGVLRTSDGQVCLEHGSHCYAMMEFVESKSDNQIDAVLSTAKSLASLHDALRTCSIVPSTKTVYQDLSPAEVHQIKELTAARSSAFQREVEEFFVLRSVIPPIDTTTSPEQLVHLDCHPGNVRFPQNTSATIIDFGHIQKMPRMLAVSFACHRFAGLDLKQVQSFFDAYSSLDPLNEKEIDSHWSFVAAECVRRINCLLRLHFFEGCQDWDFELSRQMDTLRQITPRALSNTT